MWDLGFVVVVCFDFCFCFEFLDFERLLEYFISTEGFYQFHQISFLCHRHELACTPKDPPRRVDMKEMNLICLCKETY